MLLLGYSWVIVLESGFYAARLPSSFMWSSHLARFTAPPAPSMPKRVSRTGLMPTKFRMLRRIPAIPCPRNQSRYRNAHRDYDPRGAPTQKRLREASALVRIGK